MKDEIRVDIEQVDEELVRARERALDSSAENAPEEAGPYRANGAKHGGVPAPR